MSEPALDPSRFSECDGDCYLCIGLDHCRRNRVEPAPIGSLASDKAEIRRLRARIAELEGALGELSAYEDQPEKGLRNARAYQDRPEPEVIR